MKNKKTVFFYSFIIFLNILSCKKKDDIKPHLENISIVKIYPNTGYENMKIHLFGDFTGLYQRYEDVYFKIGDSIVTLHSDNTIKDKHIIAPQSYSDQYVSISIWDSNTMICEASEQFYYKPKPQFVKYVEDTVLSFRPFKIIIQNCPPKEDIKEIYAYYEYYDTYIQDIYRVEADLEILSINNDTLTVRSPYFISSKNESYIVCILENDKNITEDQPICFTSDYEIGMLINYTTDTRLTLYFNIRYIPEPTVKLNDIELEYYASWPLGNYTELIYKIPESLEAGEYKISVSTDGMKILPLTTDILIYKPLH